MCDQIAKGRQVLMGLHVLNGVVNSSGQNPQITKLFNKLGRTMKLGNA